MDAHGHIYDANMSQPYQVGPSNVDRPPYVSDPSHPEYDPAIDPNLQLRTVRTAAESIAESHRSEMRRDQRAKARRRGAGGSILGRIGRGKTLLRKDNAHRRKTSAGIVEMVQDELGRIRQGQDQDQELHMTGMGEDPTEAEPAGMAFESAQSDFTPAGHEMLPSKPDQSLKKKSPWFKVKAKPAKRRNVYMNVAPSPQDTNARGEITARYPRNKVRTSKYTVVSFLPRFLGEQFRRLANIYFLGLVLLQVRHPLFTLAGI